MTINIVGAFESSIRWIMDHASIGLRAYGQFSREYNRYQLSAERLAKPKHAFSPVMFYRQIEIIEQNWIENFMMLQKKKKKI